MSDFLFKSFCGNKEEKDVMAL